MLRPPLASVLTWIVGTVFMSDQRQRNIDQARMVTGQLTPPHSGDIPVTTLFTLTHSLLANFATPRWSESPSWPVLGNHHNRSTSISALGHGIVKAARTQELTVVNGFISLANTGPALAPQLLLESEALAHKELMVNFLNVVT